MKMGNKSYIKKMKKLITDPDYRFTILTNFGVYNKMSDELYLKKLFRIKFGYELNLKDPKTFSEKIQWLKLYNRKKAYIQMVDKYAVKDYVASIIGKEYVIPTIGVWNSVDDIDFNALPAKFVLKCTHDSGGIIICKDKNALDITAAKKLLKKALKTSYYSANREWPYKYVVPRIIAEPYMEDSETGDLKDYKFFVFNGIVKAMYVASDRQNKEEETKFDFFDADFNHLPFENAHPNASALPIKPKCFAEMKNIAERLGKNIPQVRIDLYEVDGHVYFGEITFFHMSGLAPFVPDKWDKIFGDWIELPKKK